MSILNLEALEAASVAIIGDAIRVLLDALEGKAMAVQAAIATKAAIDAGADAAVIAKWGTGEDTQPETPQAKR